MKLLPDKKAIRITVLGCAAAILLESWGNRHTRGFSEPLYLLQFMAFLYFIPVIKARKKAVLYSILIPFYCCLATLVLLSVILYIMKWKILFSSVAGESVWDIGYYFIGRWIFSQYIFSLSWMISLFLMFVYGLYRRVSRQSVQSSEGNAVITPPSFQEIVLEMGLFQHKKLYFCTIIIYLLFMITYLELYQLLWFEDVNVRWSYCFFAHVCSLSFVSLFLFAPVVIGCLKRSLAFCMIIPLFWSIVVFILLTIVLTLFTGNYHLIIDSIFSIRIYPYMYRHQVTADICSIYFYLDRYLKTHAWLIGFPLLLVCHVYAKLAKSELARRMRQTQAGEDKTTITVTNP